MKPIALLFNGVWSQYALATAPKYRHLIDLVYIHDLTDADLQDRKALLIPFQSHQPAIAQRKDTLYRFLNRGGKIFIEGDSTPEWLDALWEDRPVDNYWWVKNPGNPPVSETDYSHPIYTGLSPRHACWHIHGIYTRVPATARVIQRNAAGEAITWETTEHGGVLLATTLDPIVEHGIQQIRHLDNYFDNLVRWLTGEQPEGPFTIDPAAYGISEFPAPQPQTT